MSAAELFQVAEDRYAVRRNRWDLLAGANVAPAEISVVIPYYRDQAMLDLVLAGLTVQTHPRTRLQVIIADDGSPEPPRIDEQARCLAPVVLRQEDAGFRLAAARNLGLRHAEGAVVAFLDGDTVPEPDYLQHLSRLPSVLPDAVVAGRRRHADLTSWTADGVLRWFRGEIAPPAELPEPDWLNQEYQRSDNLLRVGPRSFTYLIGAVLAASREMCSEIAGFDEAMVGYGGEDYDFGYRAWVAGAVLAHVPNAIAWHDGPDWVGRVPDAGQRRIQKNAEVAMLAGRIPEPSFRGTGQWYPSCDVIVEIDCAGWTLGAGLLCVQALLATVDCGVWLSSAGDAAAAAIRAAFDGDPRVRSGTVPGWVAARARARLALSLPVVVTEEFPQTVQRMLAQDCGRLTVMAGSVVLAVVTNSRAARRSARWAGRLPGADATSTIDLLFGETLAAASDVGVVPMWDEPDLAASFGGWSERHGRTGAAGGALG